MHKCYMCGKPNVNSSVTVDNDSGDITMEVHLCASHCEQVRKDGVMTFRNGRKIKFVPILRSPFNGRIRN